MKLKIKQAIDRGGITSTDFRREGAVVRYQGNGRFGGVYSRLGLHAHPEEKSLYDQHGGTQFTHLSRSERQSLTLALARDQQKEVSPPHHRTVDPVMPRRRNHPDRV